MTVSALTIAGTDPSGGAGLQADLRVFELAGLAGWSVATAITIQNTKGVTSWRVIEPEVIRDQLEAVFADVRDLRAVKIGMLGGAAQVRAVADALRRWRPQNVVLDPVLASTGGVLLLDGDGLVALREELVPLCDLVTPNLDEVSQIGSSAGAVLVKGGHAKGDPTDVLYRAGEQVREFSAPRVDTSHTHGTGCALAAAIAAELALGSPLGEAIARAKCLVTRALQSPAIAGNGRGYPDVRGAAAALRFGCSAAHQERIRRIRGIYVITDATLRPDRSHEEIIQAALDGGANVIQFRDKSLPLRESINVARRLGAMARERRALFIVNDRPDVALVADADGVHVGPDDFDPADARRVAGADKIVGMSVSTLEEATAVAPYSSYFGVGAIYGSRTKDDAGEPVGVRRIAEIRDAFPHIPIVAVGGIGSANIAEVARSGATAAAVLSAVVCAEDMRAATAELVRAWRRETLAL
jgi:hydroxymethylpyrimidine kinase/phosphomethylpyrimidine kinase/thiamine-phosphate diphosphorylase